jgi:hypothetical protein
MSKVKAKISGFVAPDGVHVLLTEGEEYDTGHPLVQARPDLFTDPPAPRRPALRSKGKVTEKAAPSAHPEPTASKPKRGDG